VIRNASLCAVTPLATDDARQAAEAVEFQQKLDTMVATTANAIKKYDATHTRVLATTTLLEEEKRAAAVLTEEAHAAVTLIKAPTPTPPQAPASHAAPSDDDYEAAVITNIHVKAASVQNIRSLVSVSLDLSSTHYAQWCDNILLTLERYSLSVHVLLDSDVKSWIWGTISPNLQDITWQRGHTARDARLGLENHFLGNRETRALHIDATFRSFMQGDLSVNDYYQKMKGFADSLVNLSVDITDRVLVLNVLRGLNKNFKHLPAIFMHTTPFLSFKKVLDDLCLEKIQQGV
jgi:hypothetical protein